MAKVTKTEEEVRQQNMAEAVSKTEAFFKKYLIPLVCKRADKFCRQMRAGKAGKLRVCADLSAKHADKCRQILQTKKKEAASALASRRVSLINFRYIGYPWGIIA